MISRHCSWRIEGVVCMDVEGYGNCIAKGPGCAVLGCVWRYDTPTFSCSEWLHSDEKQCCDGVSFKRKGV